MGYEQVAYSKSLSAFCQALLSEIFFRVAFIKRSLIFVRLVERTNEGWGNNSIKDKAYGITQLEKNCSISGKVNGQALCKSMRLCLIFIFYFLLKAGKFTQIREIRGLSLFHRPLIFPVGSSQLRGSCLIGFPPT